jgi:hypothetical protein
MSFKMLSTEFIAMEQVNYKLEMQLASKHVLYFNLMCSMSMHYIIQKH